MTFNEKKEIYAKLIGVGYIGISGKDFFKVLSLLCRITNAYKKKTGRTDVSSMEVLNMFFKPRSKYEEEIVENVCVHCDFQLGIDLVEFDDYGLKTAKEVQTEIVNILSNYLPF